VIYIKNLLKEKAPKPNSSSKTGGYYTKQAMEIINDMREEQKKSTVDVSAEQAKNITKLTQNVLTNSSEFTLIPGMVLRLIFR
jgi:hypothetical protein